MRGMVVKIPGSRVILIKAIIVQPRDAAFAEAVGAGGGFAVRGDGAVGEPEFGLVVAGDPEAVGAGNGRSDGAAVAGAEGEVPIEHVEVDAGDEGDFVGGLVETVVGNEVVDGFAGDVGPEFAGESAGCGRWIVRVGAELVFGEVVETVVVRIAMGAVGAEGTLRVKVVGEHPGFGQAGVAGVVGMGRVGNEVAAGDDFGGEARLCGERAEVPGGGCRRVVGAHGVADEDGGGKTGDGDRAAGFPDAAVGG